MDFAYIGPLRMLTLLIGVTLLSIGYSKLCALYYIPFAFIVMAVSLNMWRRGGGALRTETRGELD